VAYLIPVKHSVSYLSYGKDEKLRLRFDSSESEKALPQATTRRAKRAALSHPSPTTIISRQRLNQSSSPPQADFTPW
ncbi:hypothetical protein SEEN2570_17994, partial [Salmonella enterica subsp. enterica serovar Newport str. VA_R100512570]